MISLGIRLPQREVGQLETCCWSKMITEWIFPFSFFPEGEKDYLLLLPSTHLCVETLDNSPVTPRGVVVIGESARTTHTLRESCGLLRLSRLQRLEQPQTCHQLPSPPSPQSTTAGQQKGVGSSSLSRHLELYSPFSLREVICLCVWAKWQVEVLVIWRTGWLQKMEKTGWRLVQASWIQSSAFQEWPKVSALGLFGWPLSSFHRRSWHQMVPWLPFSLARSCAGWAEDTASFLPTDGLLGASCQLLNCAILVLWIQHHCMVVVSRSSLAWSYLTCCSFKETNLKISLNTSTGRKKAR